MTTSAQHVIAISGLVSGRADRLEPSSSISHNTDPASQENDERDVFRRGRRK
jgi:hypothetical protein